MSQVIIIVNAQVERGIINPTAPVAEKMALALSQSIVNSSYDHHHTVEIVSGADLWSKSIKLSPPSADVIYCPLTIKLPDWFDFPAQKIYRVCRDVEKMRIWVYNHFGFQVTQDNLCLGDLWLPMIFTEEKLVYGSIIAEGMIPNDYRQPYFLPTPVRSHLYRLGEQLLEYIGAIPSVYLLQFRLKGDRVIFDRLWPFPATPAIASINVQKPDLFACHWRCLSSQSVDSIFYESIYV